MACWYASGIDQKASMTSLAIWHLSFRLTLPSSTENRTMRSSCTVAVMLAAWNPNRSLWGSKVMSRGICLKHSGSARYICMTYSRTDATVMEFSARSRKKMSWRKEVWRPLSDLLSRNRASACSRMRYRSVVKFQPYSQLEPVGEVWGDDSGTVSEMKSSSTSIG